MNVAELASTLGWDVDFETIARYQSELNKARENTEKLEADTRKLAEAEQALAEMTRLGAGPVALENRARKELAVEREAAKNAASALAMISPGDPAGAAGAADKAGKAGLGWGRAMEIANASLGTAMKGYTILRSAVDRVRGAFDATAAAAAHANDMSAKTGLSVEAVQEYGYAASQAGSDVDTLGNGLKTLADKADAASKGGKDAARALHAVGLSGKDIKSGKVLPDEALGKIADHFAALPDGARKSALAVDLFGGAGVKLIPLLNKGSAGIAALRAEARDLGIVMSGDTTAAVADLGDAQSKLGDQLGGIRNQVMAALVPMLAEMAAGLSAWLTENRATIVEVLTYVGKGILYVAQAVGAIARAVAVAVGWMIDNWEVLAAVLAIVMWPLTMIAATIAGIIIAFPYVLAAAKAVGAGIVAAFTAAGSAIAKAFHAVVRAVGAAWDAIKSAGRAIGSFFADVGRGIADVFNTAVNGVISAINFVIDKLDWAITQANRLPGVDIGHIGQIAKVGGGGGKATAAAPGGATVNNSIGEINVTSPAADPAQVAVHVRREVASAFESMMLEADTALPAPQGVA